MPDGAGSAGRQAPPPRHAPPGRFDSPIPDLDEVRRREASIWGTPPSEVPGIQLNIAQQLALVAGFAPYCEEMPFVDARTADRRYHFRNPSFGYGDAVALYCMIRHARPERIIEAGCGYSSAVILDTNELFFRGNIETTFIDPHPQALLSLLKESDRGVIHLLPRPLQDVSLEMFRTLRQNDILFIDSSHVAKIGSDVNYLFGEILPSLAIGVYIHIHDVFWPFEYPKEWIYRGDAWNEAYMLRSFLQFNPAFEIVLFGNYLGHFHADAIQTMLPTMRGFQGSGSVWLRRCA